MTSHGKLTTKPVVQLCLAMKLLQLAVAQTFILGDDTEIYTRRAGSLPAVPAGLISDL